MRQIRPSSPSGAVSCDTAKPCAGRWLSSTRTVHSGNAIGTSMSPRVAAPRAVPACHIGRVWSDSVMTDPEEKVGCGRR